VLAIMATIRATFTLPGIAGIILTIGMSVDANVLIFERIREEQQKGSSLRIAVANGYQRAFRTIFDANLTTFITAAILYWVASEEIKGFAIVLMLGIASSMFTALFVTRLVFDLLLSKRLIKDHLVMLRLIHKPNVNWMRMRPVFFAISILLIAGGLTVFFTRDNAENNKYDIEFTGGTQVELALAVPEGGEGLAETPQRLAGGERVVDARRQGPYGHFGELAHASFHVPGGASRWCEDERAGKGLAGVVVEAAGDPGQGSAFHHEGAPAVEELDHQVPFPGQAQEPAGVDLLNVPAVSCRYGAGPVGEAIGEDLVDLHGRPDALFFVAGGERLSDGPIQLGAGHLDDPGGLDGGGGVVDEVDEHRHAGESQEECQDHGQLWDPGGAGLHGHAAEHEEAVDEGGDEGPEHGLVAAVPEESPEEAGTELGGGQGEGDDEDGEGHPCHGDHGSGQGGEEGPSALGLAGAMEPRDHGHPPVQEGPVEGQDRLCGSGGGQGHDGGEDPVAGLECVPETEKSDLHVGSR